QPAGREFIEKPAQVLELNRFPRGPGADVDRLHRGAHAERLAEQHRAVDAAADQHRERQLRIGDLFERHRPYCRWFGITKMTRMATLAEAFPDIVRTGEALAAYTLLRLGGPAEFLAQPRSVDELASLMKACAERKLPVRILGIGSALLVGDEGVKGVVLRLSAPAFGRIEI